MPDAATLMRACARGRKSAPCQRTDGYPLMLHSEVFVSEEGRKRGRIGSVGEPISGELWLYDLTNYQRRTACYDVNGRLASSVC
jgi:hypothetical protein